MSDLMDLDSMEMKTPGGKSAMAITAPDIPLDVNVVSGDVTITAGTINVEDVVLDPTSSTHVEPGADPLHAIVDSGAVEVTPGAVFHAVVDSGHIIADSVTAQVNAKLNSQASISGDGVLTTDYAQDYMVRGKAFQIQRRITLTSQQTLHWVVDFTGLTGKMIFALPVSCRSAGGLVFLDTYIATSYTGGSVETPNKLNGNSATNPLAVVKSGVAPTGSSDLREYSIGTLKTNQSAGGGSGGAEVPKILANAPRIFKFVNQESSAVTIDFGFVWYELDI